MSNAIKNVCIYHANCADGAAAAWVVEETLENVESVPFRYGEDIPLKLVTGADVYIVDFSFPKGVIEALEQVTNKLVVLDHHKSALDELATYHPNKDSTVIELDMGRSGAMMAWDHFYHPLPAPYHIVAVQDHDLWRFHYPDTEAIVEYAYFMGATPGNYRKGFSGTNRMEVTTIGEILVKKRNQLVAATVKRARVEVVHYKGVEYKVPYVNCPPDLSSHVGHELCKLYGSEFSVAYHDNKDVRVHSLRSNGKFDCAAYCEQYGGGGHPSAAGYSTPRPN